MQFLAAALLGGLYNIAGTLAGQVLIGLGISVITYQGIDVTLTWLKAQVESSILGLPGEMVGLISYMGVGEAVAIIASAYTVRLTLSGLTSGTMKAWVKK